MGLLVYSVFCFVLFCFFVLFFYNNRKETVERLLFQSVEKNSWPWPSRVRTDQGRENVLVWGYLFAIRGSDRGSALVAALFVTRE